MDKSKGSSLTEVINSILVETEEYANEFLPLRERLGNIKGDFDRALEELKNNANRSTDVADKVFYTNKYLDLIKRAEGIFDMRSKRLQQTVSMMSKLDLGDAINDAISGDGEGKDDIQKKLTPEQANKLLKVLNEIQES